jgi:hypothetical protein
LLLALASTLIFRFYSHGTRDHISLFQIRDSPNLGVGQVSVFKFPRSSVAQLYPQALGSLFVTYCYSQAYVGVIRPHLHTGDSFSSYLAYLYVSARHGPRRKYNSSVAVHLLSWKRACLRSHYLATAVL